MKIDTNKNRLAEMDATMNKTIHLILILVLTLLLFSQLKAQVSEEWVQRYNGPGNSSDNTSSMVVDSSGNVYVTGSSKSGPGNDYATIKYNSAGAEQWVARYNRQGDSTDIASSIAVDGSGNVYVTGQSWGSGSGYDYATIKYNSSGAEEWVAIYNGPGNSNDVGSSIAVDSSGNVYVTGYSFGGSVTILDYATIKYNSAGAQQWVARYNGPGNGQDWARAIAVDGSSNVYVTGFSDGTLTTVRDYATVKYNSAGTQQWVKRYNGPGNDLDFAWAIAVDGSGNVYVTGFSKGSGTNTDYATIKYNSAGTQLWVQRYNGPGNSGDDAHSIAVDGSGSVYVTGISGGIGTNGDYATIKYNSSGVQQWVARYNGPGNSIDWASSLALDGLGNIYVTGWSIVSGINYDYATVKYSASGGQQWVIRYNGPGNESDNAQSIALDDSGNVYVTGSSAGSGTGSDYATIKYLQLGTVYQPDVMEKWIAGETNTIKWTNEGWSSVNIKCTLNFETPQQTEYTIAQGFLITNPEYVWEIPDSLLSYRSKIIIENAADTTQTMESGVFRLKPYVLTRVNSDSTYYAYDKANDQWGFQNDSSDVWPEPWYNQFNYQGIDPFTGISYSQIEGDSTFAKSRSLYHPDWVSWVNTFTTDACYYDTTYGIYKPTAVLKWWAVSNNWGGSCFGIAVANALAFGYKDQFVMKYPTFPDFINPISVLTSNEVIKVINELFTHQLGNPHLNYKINIGMNKTPTNTLVELKNMFREDISEVRTLSLMNNGPGGGGHAINAYGLEKDTLNPNIYYVKVYDNSYPNSNNRITINTSANGGNGDWVAPNQGWGGTQWLYLRNPVFNYLFNPTMAKANQQNSPFILNGNELQIFTRKSPSIQIVDQSGNISGFVNNIIYNDIPGSAPLVVDNGSKTPPYGYMLTNDEYSVIMNNFTADTVEAFFFTGYNSFSYERSGALQTQTDRLYFAGGVSVTNPDVQTKSVKLLNIINETTSEKVFILRSIELVQNDSVEIKNPNNDKLKFISYGSAKDYAIELNFAAETGFGRFGNFNIPLSANTTHTFVPNWPDIANNDLMVLVDIGNNGTIDDTLFLQNQVTGVGDDHGSLLMPGHYNLAQNYPNPFNPATVIRYQLPVNSHVSLKVFDVLGREVATLVNENKNPGSYEVEFDGSKLPSGVYFYRLSAGNYIETKKLLLVR